MFTRINTRLILLAVSCCLLWGTAIPVLKISYQAIGLALDDVYSKMVFAGMRFMLSGVLVFIYYIIRHKKIPSIDKVSILPFIIFGILNTALQYAFFYTGVANTTAIKGVLLDTAKPLIVVVLAHFIYKNDKININKTLGLVLGFAGIIIVNINQMNASNLSVKFSFYGEGFLLLASLASAIAVIYGKSLSLKYEPIVMNCYQFIFGSTLLLLVGLIGAGGFHLKFNLIAIILLLYSAILSAVAFVIWYSLLQKYKATSVTIYLFLIPVFGTIISSIILPTEVINIRVLISLILSSLGIFLVNKQVHKKRLILKS